MIAFIVKIWTNIPKQFKNYMGKVADKNDYFRVYIFDTKENMYDYVDKVEKKKIERDYAGRCLSFVRYFVEDKTNKIYYSNKCGNIYFVRGRLGGSVVSHECGHAVIGYFNRRIENYKEIFEDSVREDYKEYCDGIDVQEANIKDYDELFCYMLGELVGKIYNEIYKRNLIEVRYERDMSE